MLTQIFSASCRDRSVAELCCPDMFTLCMSRGPPPLQDNENKNCMIPRADSTTGIILTLSVFHMYLISRLSGTRKKQMKGGYLLRYKKGFFCKDWCEEWVVLYEDSTLAWFADKTLTRLRGFVRISDAPDLLAVGEWTKKVPRRPRLSHACHVGQLLAVGCRRRKQVHWLMAASTADINDWMTAISNTLPLPPHIPIDEKRLTLTSYQQDLPNGRAHPVPNGYATPIYDRADLPAAITSKFSAIDARLPSSFSSNKPVAYSNTVNNLNMRNRQLDKLADKKAARNANNDYTVLDGVVIWGHGWGWNQTAMLSTTTCSADAAVVSAISYHAAGDDCAMSGYDADVDWSVFGDFCF